MTYAKISSEMMSPRDIAGNIEEEDDDEEKEEEEGEEEKEEEEETERQSFTTTSFFFAFCSPSHVRFQLSE